MTPKQITSTKRQRLERAARGVCIFCPRKAEVRGLCRACRMAARRAVERGQTNEAELIGKGYLLPKSKGGRLARSGFAKTFSLDKKKREVP